MARKRRATQDEAFLQAICETPGDDGPRQSDQRCVAAPRAVNRQRELHEGEQQGEDE